MPDVRRGEGTPADVRGEELGWGRLNSAPLDEPVTKPTERTTVQRRLVRGFERLINTIHPAAVPLLARRSYALELTTTLFFSIALACVEGGVIAVVVKKTFGAVVAAAVLNVAVAFVGAASEIANIISFVWTQWSHGREKVAFINGLQVGLLVLVAAMALVPVSGAGLAAMVVGVIVARTCWSGIITLRPTIWRANYPPLERARVVGRFSAVQVVMVAGVGLFLGRSMDVDASSFRWILPAAAVMGIVAVVAYRRLRVRRAGKMLRHETAMPRVMAPWNGLASVARILKRDKFFALFQLWLFVLGTGNLMATPILVLTVNDQFHMTYAQGILITSSLTALCTGGSIPLWAKFLDRSHVVKFRSIHSWVFVVGTTTLSLAVITHQAWLLGVGAAIQGIGFGGGALAWNLGHVDFAPPNETSHYMAAHVTLNGIRGLLAPFIVVGLYNLVAARWPGAKESGVASFVPLTLSNVFSLVGAIGYVGLRRQMGALAASVRRDR